jgi:hypothetical protein
VLGLGKLKKLPGSSRSRAKLKLLGFSPRANYNNNNNNKFIPDPSVLSVPVENLKIRIHKTIMLPVVLYGCETWSLTLREEHRLKAFGNRVLRRIFGPRRDEVTEEWRKLHNEELHDLYSSPTITRIIKFRRMRLAGHVARMGRR